MNDLTKANQVQPSKATVAMFVQDAMDMEVKAYTLKKIADEVEKEIKTREENMEPYVENAEKKKEALQKNYENYVDRRDNYTFKQYKKDESRTVLGMLILLIGGIFATGGVGLLLIGFIILISALILLGVSLLMFGWEATDDFLNNNSGAFLLYSTLFAAISAILISIPVNKSAYKREIRFARANAERTYKELGEVETEIKEAYKKEAEEKAKLKALKEHLAFLSQSCEAVAANLKNHYSLGIIPPDYRDMVRVTYINRAFRNDQVDTMREATLLCDRDVHHEIIKGALIDIATSLHSISDTLISINTNIEILSADICKLVDIQEKTLTESKSARYAAEAVKASTDRLVMYEEMKRNGTF